MPRLGAFAPTLPGAVGQGSAGVGAASPPEQGAEEEEDCLAGLDDDDDVKSEVDFVRQVTPGDVARRARQAQRCTIAELYARANAAVAKPETFYRVTKVMGKVVRVWSIPPVKAWARQSLYCVVKGIRQSAALVHIGTTKVVSYSYTTCMLNFEFSFDVPEDWAVVNLVGLKIMLYACEHSSPSAFGTEELLGGADIDLAHLASRRLHSLDLVCDGTSLKHIRSKKAQKDLVKPRMKVDVVVLREKTPKPLSPWHLLIPSLREFKRVQKMTIHIIEANGLRRGDFLGKSDPQCIVSVVLSGGQARELYRTEVVKQSLSPEWHERFEVEFPKKRKQDPMLLIFDIYDWDTDEVDITESGEHLGSIVVPISSLGESSTGKVLHLQDSSSLLDNRLDQKGFPINRRKGVRDLMDDGRRDPTRPTSRSAAVRQKLETWWKHRSDRFKNGTLVIDFDLDIVEEPMPHLELMKSDRSIETEMDGQEWLESWKTSLSAFEHPTHFDDGTTSTVGLSITGHPRIIFVMGTLHGCSGLVGPGCFEQTNPYVIIEGCSDEGDKQFIHRTRVAVGNNNPQFMEPFFIALGGREFDKFDMRALVISIYNAADGSGTGTEDSLLGNAVVDVSTWRNRQEFNEEVPLNGVQRTVLSGAGHFRRPSVVSLRAFVERRIKPELKLLAKNRPNMAPVPRNVNSRETGKTFIAADETLFSSERPAARALHMHYDDNSFGLLARSVHPQLRKRRNQKWLVSRHGTAARVADGDGDLFFDVESPRPSSRASTVNGVSLGLDSEQTPAIKLDLNPSSPTEGQAQRQAPGLGLRVNSWLMDFQADAAIDDTNVRKPEYELYDWSGLGQPGSNSSWLVPRVAPMKVSAPKTLPPQLHVEDGEPGSKWKKETMDQLRVMWEIRQRMPTEYMTKVRDIHDLD